MMSRVTIIHSKSIPRFHFAFLICCMTLVYLPTRAQDVIYLKGSTEKISQLVGDFDRHLNSPTINLTETRYKLWGTDLGVPFQHKGQTIILFGDVPGTDRDPVAYSIDMDPTDGLALTFVTDNNGVFQPITIPGISQGAFEVPVEGISREGTIYIYHTTNTMGRSVLARSSDEGNSFQLIENNFSELYFINVSLVEVNVSEWTGLPQTDGTGLILFGSGDYRKSNLYMAFQPADYIERKEEIRYFTGINGGTPQWSSDENQATSLFEQPCLGEFSVTYNDFINKWILLYNCDEPRGINFRSADFPWGPWSETQLIFEPWEDQGYCHFMHVNWQFRNCDQVHDPGRENEWGGEYGPYQFEHFASGNENSTTIYYTLSTWNPYTVVLMRSTLIVNTTLTSTIPEPQFSICPNPWNSSNTLTIKHDGDGEYQFCLYNRAGIPIREDSIECNSTIFSKQNHSPGIYIYAIKDEHNRKISSGKLVVY